MQWLLVLENDFTLPKDSFFRVQIDGKGCDGFTYATCFTSKRDNDREVTVQGQILTDPPLVLLMDPFTAFYVEEATVDYIQDFEQGEEGFFVANHRQHEFQGKFWTDDPSKIPELPEQDP